jgi:hypothetical protein
MIKLFALFVGFIVLSSSTFAAENLKSMKGWDLYSWRVGKAVHYALLEGTNRLKTADEILKADLGNVEAVKAKLSELAAGEQIVWNNQVGIENASGGPSIKLSLPAHKIKKDLFDLCREHQLKLTSARTLRSSR